MGESISVDVKRVKAEAEAEAAIERFYKAFSRPVIEYALEFSGDD